MNIIDKQKLKKRLIEEGYVEAFALDRTVDYLLALDGNARKMLEGWLFNNESPNFDAIEGIDSVMLREQMKMKNPAIILSYGMLLKDAKMNSGYLKSLLTHRENFRMEYKTTNIENNFTKNDKYGQLHK